MLHPLFFMMQDYLSHQMKAAEDASKAATLTIRSHQLSELFNIFICSGNSEWPQVRDMFVRALDHYTADFDMTRLSDKELELIGTLHARYFDQAVDSGQGK